jgi:hypothetical protein
MFGTGVVSLGPSVTTNGGIAVPTSPTSEAALQVSDATPGAPMTATLAGTAGALGALVFANQGPPFVVPEITGALWLQPASAIAVAAGVFGTTLPVTVNVPNDPALLAQSFAWQGLTWSSVSGFAASNPGWFTIR